MERRKEAWSLSALFQDLSREMSALIRQELTLARTEMSEKASLVGKNIGFLAAGGAIAYAGFLAIMAAVIIALAMVLPWWAAALIAGAVVACVGYFSLQRGLDNLKRVDLTPHETLETLTDVTVGTGSRRSRVGPTPIRRAGSDTEAIRAGIEDTRSEMDETVDVIQERLNPQRLVGQAKAAVREATIGKAEDMVYDARNTVQETGTTIVDTIKGNPLPTALIGLGIGWLFMKSRNRPLGYGEYRTYRRPYRQFESAGRPIRERGDDMMGQTQGGVSEFVGQTQGRVGEFVGQAQDQVSEFVGQAQGQVGEFVGQTQEQVGEFVERAQTQVGQLTDQAQYQVLRARGTFQDLLEENPLAVGALAIGIGAAIGLAIPETTKEHELMGETRDKLVQQAKEIGRETQEKVQRVVSEAKTTVEQEAREQGLTGETTNS